jgi:ABC-type amino acid transport substrate-binding protein
MAIMADAIYTSTVQEAYFEVQSPGQVKIASPQQSALYIGVATVKADKELHDALADSLKKVQSNGEYDKIVKTWHCEGIAYKP